METTIRLVLWLILASLLLTACGRSPLVRPETSASQTEIAAETGDPISPVLPATKPPETPTFTPSPTTTVQTSQVSEANASPSSEPSLTPTAKPLSPLDERLGTIVFSTVGEKGPEIWRVQVNEQGQKVGPAERVDFPASSRTGMPKLYVSPDGKQIIIEVASGGEGSFLYVLDPATGQLTSLFAGRTDITDPRVTFLAWADSKNILVMGVWGSDLSDNAWLIDINSHTYHKIDITQTRGLPVINSASYSHDGAIVYTEVKCYRCGSKVWRMATGKSTPQLLMETFEKRVEKILFSPNGESLAFTQWLETTEQQGLVMGELYIMAANGDDKQLLDSLVMGYGFAWSPDGSKIAFVDKSTDSGKQSDTLVTNLYIADLLSGQKRQLTHFQNRLVIQPIWSPDNSHIAFLVGEQNAVTHFEAQIVAADTNKFGTNSILLETQDGNLSGRSNHLDIQSSLVWLP